MNPIEPSVEMREPEATPTYGHNVLALWERRYYGSLEAAATMMNEMQRYLEDKQRRAARMRKGKKRTR